MRGGAAGWKRVRAGMRTSPLVGRLIGQVLRSEPAAAAIRWVIWGDWPIVQQPDRTLLDQAEPGGFGPKVVTYAPTDPRPVRVGPYSSISDNAYLLIANAHRIDLVSSWTFLDAGIPVEEQVTNGGPITIGSDVLINFQALVLSGVTIGHGAVVAARAVVTKDVAPYAIVGGIPARFLAWRFDEPTRQALLRIAWWEWPKAKVDAHARQISSTDLASFVARHDPAGVTLACPACATAPGAAS